MVTTYIMDIHQFNAEPVFEACLKNVSQERRKKVQKAGTQEDKKRILGAGLLFAYGLKQIGIREQEACISYGSNGKPFLLEYPQVHFNLSHSGNYAVAAFSEAEVGIDIEHERDNGRKIAEHFFAKEELEAFKVCPDNDAERELFLRYWTLKESFLKATGQGMKLPMKDFSFKLGSPVQVKWNGKTTGYSFREFEITGQYDIMADKIEKERYRIAVCASEEHFAPDLEWIRI